MGRMNFNKYNGVFAYLYILEVMRSMIMNRANLINHQIKNTHETIYTVCTYHMYHEGTKAATECTLETKHSETEFNSSQTCMIHTTDFQVYRQ